MNELKVGGIYRHYKGNYYQALGVCFHSETTEKMVLYQALYGEKALWVRPYDMFFDVVNKEGQVHRFELVDTKKEDILEKEESK